MATMQLGLKDYKAADEQLAQANQMAPNNPAVHLNMAFSYAGQKKYTEAEREFQTALRLNPQYDAAATDYVALLFGTNQQAKALDFAKQYAASNGSRVQPHFIYATALANSKNLDQAAVEFQKCVDIEPKFMGPYVQLSRIYLGQNKPDQAVATLTEGA